MFQGGFPKFRIFLISIFSQIRFEGGGGSSNYQFFPKFKKFQNILGENMDFFHFLWHFLIRILYWVGSPVPLGWYLTSYDKLSQLLGRNFNYSIKVVSQMCSTFGKCLVHNVGSSVSEMNISNTFMVLCGIWKRNFSM